MTHCKYLVFIVLVFLCKTYALPPFHSNYNFPNEDVKFMVGNCNAETYFKQEQLCAKEFFVSIRQSRGKVTNCSYKYKKMRTCMINVFENCLRGSLVESFLAGQRDVVLENFLTNVGTEEKWCKQGGLSIPEYVYKGTFCHPIYAYTTKDCVSRYQNVFNSTSTYRRLCREYNQAQTCLFRNLLTHCSFSKPSLRQMMALLIEVQYDYQPYCFESKLNVRTFDELLNKNTCPRYAHADVMFLLDASQSTTIQEFVMMKMLIRSVAIRLNYGMSGIRIGLEQFSKSSLLSIQMDRYDSKRSFLRGLKRTRRMKVEKNVERSTGAALMKLADTQFNIGEASSTVRPFHTPIVVVLTAGESNDTTEQDAVRKLTERGVHVVRFGPTYKVNRNGRDVTYHVNNTIDYTAHYQTILDEICQADRLYRDQNVGSIEEGSSGGGGKSILDSIQESIFSRISGVNLPLLWEPDALEFIPFTIANSTEDSESEDDLLDPPLVNPFGEAFIGTFGGPNFPEISEFDGVTISEGDTDNTYRVR